MFRKSLRVYGLQAETSRYVVERSLQPARAFDVVIVSSDLDLLAQRVAAGREVRNRRPVQRRDLGVCLAGIPGRVDGFLYGLRDQIADVDRDLRVAIRQLRRAGRRLRFLDKL